MFMFFAICAVLLAAFAVYTMVKVKRDASGDVVGLAFNVPGIILTLLCLLVFLAGVLPSVGQVPAGRRGVVLRFGAVTGDVKGEGLYFVTPFVDRVQLMDVQIHAHKAPSTAASRDMQDVTTEITLNYRLDPTAVATTWRELGDQYESRIITPSVQEAVKATTARYDAEQLITNRTAVRDEIERALRERLLRHHILLDQLSITNFSFSEAFAQAIEGKQVATQNALRAQNEVVEAKAKADAAIATARGTAESIRIQAEAIRAQGGEEYVRLQAIAKWDWSLPQYMTGQSPIPFLSVK